MNYFKLIRSGIDVAPLLEEVRSQEQAWLLNTSRQDKIKVQRDTNTIFLSGPVARPDLNVNENQERRLTAVANLFPKALAFMERVAKERDAQLSRATIVRLKPKSQVSRHIDVGSYYFIRDRFHLVLYSSAGSVLMSGGEQVRMREGELWWFDNKQYHEAYNESDEWRIHYIFDLLPARLQPYGGAMPFFCRRGAGSAEPKPIDKVELVSVGHSRPRHYPRRKSAADFAERRRQQLADRHAPSVHGCETSGRDSPTCSGKSAPMPCRSRWAGWRSRRFLCSPRS